MKVTKRGRILPHGYDEQELVVAFYDYPSVLAQAEADGWKLKSIGVKWPPHRLEATLRLYKFTDESQIQRHTV